MSQVVAKASRPCWVQANSWLSSTIALDSREARKWPQAPSTSHPPRLSSPHFLPPGDPGADVSTGTAARETPAARGGVGWGVNIQSLFFLDARWGVPLISFLPHPPWHGPLSGGDGRGEALPTSSPFKPCSPSPPQPFPQLVRTPVRKLLLFTKPVAPRGY